MEYVPSRQMLLSVGCVGITRAIQMVASDNIANVERQSARERRNSRIKDQTYWELVSDASAALTLQQLRVVLQDKDSYPDRGARQTEARVGPRLYEAGGEA